MKHTPESTPVIAMAKVDGHARQHGIAFEYDVAISFLDQDKAIALQLADLFAGRLRTFVYLQQQNVVAGTDGEKTFGEVFRQDARLVVVLFRDGWGATPWTRIEETAIRDRSMDEGFDFSVFVKLDDASKMPRWLPRQRIYVGWSQYGPKGAASVIEERLREAGGEPTIETLSDRVTRFERHARFQTKRESFLKSYEGVAAAGRSASAVFDKIVATIPSIATSAPTLKVECQTDQSGLYLYSSGPLLRVQLRSRWANDLTDAALEAALWEGHPPRPGYYTFEKATQLVTKSFVPDMAHDNSLCWKLKRKPDGEREHNADQVAEAILEWWLDQLAKRSAHA